MEAATEAPTGTIEVLAIPGSIGAGSFDVDLIHSAAREAPEGMRLLLYTEPGLWSLPPYAPGAQPNAGVLRLRTAVRCADAMLLATPEYNGSFPGVIKNAIDWAAAPLGGDDGLEGPRAPIAGKPVAVVGADPGSLGCDWAVADVRKVLEVAGARTLPDSLSIRRAGRAFSEEGKLVGRADRARLGALMDLLAVDARGAIAAP